MGQGFLNGLEDRGVAGGGALKVLPFQLKRALHDSAGGLGVVVPSGRQQSDAFSPAGDTLLDPNVGGAGGPRQLPTQRAAGANWTVAFLAGVEEGSGPCKVVWVGEEFALGGLDVATTVFAKLGELGEVGFEETKGASGSVVISNPQLEEFRDGPAELTAQRGEGEAVGGHGHRVPLNDSSGAGDLGGGACDGVMVEDWTPVFVEVEEKACSLWPEVANHTKHHAAAQLIENIPGID